MNKISLKRWIEAGKKAPREPVMCCSKEDGDFFALSRAMPEKIEAFVEAFDEWIEALDAKQDFDRWQIMKAARAALDGDK